MKKLLILALAMLVFAGIAMAQTYTTPTGSPIYNIDKLGAHQNGGRGCVGCHAPHSGARGNGGALTKTSVWDGTAKKWSNNPAVVGDSGDETLWGQDLGPIYGLGSITTGNGKVLSLTEAGMPERVKSGIVMCLSCHDGNVAKGAMMTNQSFEQVAGLLPSTYGSQPIKTLLGDDGGVAGNYLNDHPIGPNAKLSGVSHGGVTKYFKLDSATAPTVVQNDTTQAAYTTFIANYQNPIGGARAGAGWAVPDANTDGTFTVGNAYVVCTTCHTPHTMYIYTGTAPDPNDNTKTVSAYYPSFFFISAPYNPSADTANGTKASSATQFCRSCHFTSAGGSNEGSGIMGVKTAF